MNIQATECLSTFGDYLYYEGDDGFQAWNQSSSGSPQDQFPWGEELGTSGGRLILFPPPPPGLSSLPKPILHLWLFHLPRSFSFHEGTPWSSFSGLGLSCFPRLVFPRHKCPTECPESGAIQIIETVAPLILQLGTPRPREGDLLNFSEVKPKLELTLC